MLGKLTNTKYYEKKILENKFELLFDNNYIQDYNTRLLSKIIIQDYHPTIIIIQDYYSTIIIIQGYYTRLLSKIFIQDYYSTTITIQDYYSSLLFYFIVNGCTYCVLCFFLSSLS